MQSVYSAVSQLDHLSFLNEKTVLFQAILYSISIQFSSIWLIDRTLPDAATPGQSEPGSNGNEEILLIPQSSSISLQFISIWPIDRTLSGAKTLSQGEPGSDGNKGVLCIAQISSITGASPSDCCPVGWGCRIHQLQLCSGVKPPKNECPGYDTKQSDGEVPMMLGLWGMQSTS